MEVCAGSSIHCGLSLPRRGFREVEQKLSSRHHLATLSRPLPCRLVRFRLVQSCTAWTNCTASLYGRNHQSRAGFWKVSRGGLELPSQKTKWTLSATADSQPEPSDEPLGELSGDDPDFPLLNLPWDWDPANLPDFSSEAFLEPSDEPEEDGAANQEAPLGPPPYRPLDEGYVQMFVGLLGLDRPVEERIDTCRSLWAHVLAGSQQVAEVANVPGGIMLVVTLMQSDKPAAAYAAAGLLRTVVADDRWRPLVVEAGGVEAAAGLLTRKQSTTDVREQAAGLLYHLASSPATCQQLVHLEVVPTLVAMLASTQAEERQVAACCVARLVQGGPHLWEYLVGCAVIQPLVQVVIEEEANSKLARQEAKAALSTLAKDPLYRTAVIEEGLVPVPLIGVEAYKSFKPLLHAPPPLPEPSKKGNGGAKYSKPKESPFGAGELLLGLGLPSEGVEMDEESIRLREGRIRQQFLARIGVMEKTRWSTREDERATGSGQSDRRSESEPDRKSESETESETEPKPESDSVEKMTVMPRWDGIPRLVLILGLDDAEVAARAAEAVADFVFSEENRACMKSAGAVPHLVRLLGSGSERATQAAALALERLAVSPAVRRSIINHEAVDPLIALLRANDAPPAVKQTAASALLRLTQGDISSDPPSDPGPMPELLGRLRAEEAESEARGETGEVLEEVSWKGDPRGRVIATGGLPPLVQMMTGGTLGERGQAAALLCQLAEEEVNALAVVSAGVVPALESVLSLGDPLDTWAEASLATAELLDPTNQDAAERELWAAQSAAALLVSKLGDHESVKGALGASKLGALLSSVLKSSVPLEFRDPVSDALLKLRGVEVDVEVTTYDTIPRVVSELGREHAMETREEAVSRLRNLALLGRPEYVSAIADAGGIFPLVELLEEGTPLARDGALAILYHISSDEDNFPALLAANAPKALQRIVKEGAGGLERWKLALFLLRRLPV